MITTKQTKFTPEIFLQIFSYESIYVFNHDNQKINLVCTKTFMPRRQKEIVNNFLIKKQNLKKAVLYGGGSFTA